MKCAAPPIGCGMEVPSSELRTWDDLTYREWTVSGMCAKCQDETFGPAPFDEKFVPFWEDEEYEYGPLVDEYEDDCRD